MSRSKRHAAHHNRSPRGKSAPKLTLLGGLTAAEFLADYWQKRPLLIRGAIPNFQTLLTPDQLAGLATEDGVEARLVMEKGGARPWQVERGPFPRERLESLPRAHWSLLVSNLEHWLEDAGRLLDEFNFVPLWRADDLMVSLAPPGGSVGAHVDSYDVFLLQGFGRRTWQIASGGDRALRPGIDLRILKKFVPDESWDLEPGDMLYLPPGVAHHGVAVTASMTYSIGFRAPSQRDMLAHFFGLPEALTALVATDAMYQDPGLPLQANPGAINPDAVDAVTAMLRAPLEHKDVVGRWFGRHVTRLPSGMEVAPSGRRLPSVATVQRALTTGRQLWRSDHARYAHYTATDGSLYLYIDGEEYPLDPKLSPLVEALTARRSHHGRALKALMPRSGRAAEAALTLMRQMLRDGYLYFAK
ncbi:MAG: cupin domain-containing protein [Deltaproteobacteria bacterium]|nr:cupin domain-containing protein [Deltaproteobacteria bacterium]